MNKHRLFLVLAALALFVSALPLSERVSKAEDSRYFTATGHTVKGRFLDYWNTHGALAQQGYPISEEMTEKSETDGKTYTMQYFERAVFEYHPENAGTPAEVLLSLLGVFYYDLKYSGSAPGQRTSTDNPRLFNETGFTVGGVFRKYWESHGGLAQQGYPISEEFQEVSDTDGKTYTVQYFQRAVFEYHPEYKGTSSEVLLSLLGVFYYDRRHGAGSPPPSGPAPTPAPSGPTAQVFMYDGRRTNANMSVGQVDSQGNFVLQTSDSISNKWTHVMAVGNHIVFLYKMEDGSAMTVRVNADGSTTTLKEWGANGFLAGWTTMAAQSDGLAFFYHNGTTFGIAGRFNSDGSYTSLTSYNTLQTGWTQIRPLSNGLFLFYNATSGGGDVARVNGSTGALTDLKIYSFSPNWSWITEGGNRTVLFYKISDGTGATGVIDDSGNLAQLANYPKKDDRYYGGKVDLGAGWSHVLYLSNGLQLFYKQNGGNSAVWKLRTDGLYDSVKVQGDNLGNEWAEVVGVK